MTEKHICTLHLQQDVERRTCSQKFHGLIQDMFLVSDKNPRAMLYFRSHTVIQSEKWRQRMSKRTIIHPFSEFRRYLEYLMITIFLIHLIVAPWDMYHDAIFAVELELKAKLLLAFTFFFNIVDIFATFHTGYQDEKTDEVVIDLPRIRRNYASSWLFLADLIASIPLELIITYLPYSQAHTLRWLNLLTVSRLFRLPTTIIYMNNVADLWQLSPLLYRAIRYFVYAILILHWSTCISAVICQYSYIYNIHRTQQNWVRVAAIRFNSNAILIYFYGMFRTGGQLMGVTHGVCPNLTIEDRLMAIVLFMVGYFLMGFVLILTLQLLMAQAGPHLMNLAFLNQLQMYMTRIRLPSREQKKVTAYYKYLFRQNSFYDSESLNLLSDQLRHEIVMHSYRNLMKNISIMAAFSQASIEEMLKYVHREIIMPGDFVMQAGMPGDCMYFIVNGTIALTTCTGIEVCHLHDGAYFGEIALISESSKRTLNAVALEICEICRLERRHFNLCIDKESLAYKLLKEQTVERQKHLEELDAMHTSVMRRKTRRTTLQAIQTIASARVRKSVESIHLQIF